MPNHDLSSWQNEREDAAHENAPLALVTPDEAKIAKAMQSVSRLCKPRTDPDHLNWLMSIPARPEVDPDIIIADALSVGKHALEENRRLRAALEGVIRVADRKTVEFDAARAALTPTEQRSEPISFAGVTVDVDAIAEQLRQSEPLLEATLQAIEQSKKISPELWLQVMGQRTEPHPDTVRLEGKAAVSALYEYLLSVNHVHTRRGIVYASAIYDALHLLIAAESTPEVG